MNSNFSQVARSVGRGAAFVLGVCALAPAPAFAAPASRIAFPSGQIKYHMTASGMMSMNSDVTWTWDKGGALFRQDMRGGVRVGGSSQSIQTDSWVFSDGKALYSALPTMMPGQKTGVKTALKLALPRGGFNDMMTMGTGVSPSAANRVVGHGTILGHPCEIRSFNGNIRGNQTQAKVWIWQTLPLRTEVTMTQKMGGKAQVIKITSAATQVNTAFKPSPALFRLPTGYKVQSMANLQGQMGRRPRNVR